jgi:hypothetical protein
MAVMFSDPFASLFNLHQTLDASRASSLGCAYNSNLWEAEP